MRFSRHGTQVRSGYEIKCIACAATAKLMAKCIVMSVICLQINAWFLENRDPETGEYPDFPDDADAGSKVILNPPLPPPPPAPAADGKKGAKKAPEKPKGKGKGKGKQYHSLLVHAVLLLCYC